MDARMDSKKHPLDLTRQRIFAFLVLIWALIYLPSLGGPELRGEEGRRSLPAVEMLQTGDWLVPQIGGEAYYNKPPGINWLIAASFLATGEIAEWSARLVSVLFALGFVSLIVWRTGNWLSISGKLIASIVFLTNISLIEKGRLIEIETVYICLTGAAQLWWLDAFIRKRSHWEMWLVPGLLLSLGMFVKGPLILLMFYVPVLLAALWCGRWRSIINLGHLGALVLIAALFGGWFWSAHAREGQAMIDTMTGQMSGRVTTSQPNYGYWARNIVMSLVNFLPWLLFVPAMWDKRLIGRIESEPRKIYKGAAIGLVVSFVLIDAMPNMMPRYSLPIFGLASVLLGWAMSQHNELFKSDRMWRGIILVALMGCGILSIVAAGAMLTGTLEVSSAFGAAAVTGLTVAFAGYITVHRKSLKTVNKLARLTALTTALFVLHYSVYGMSLIKAEDIHRPVGTQLNQLREVGEALYAYKPGFQTFFFYVEEPLIYLTDKKEIDSSVKYLLLWDNIYKDLREEGFFLNANPEIIYNFTGRLNQGFVLVRLHWEQSED